MLKGNNLFVLVALSLTYSYANALPPGFIEELVVAGLTGPVGITSDENGRIFIWDKGGRVRILENGALLPQPLIDLNQEVNTYWTRGLTGFTLDPDYETNGYVYLAYTVDWEYYITKGHPNQANLDTNRDTFGRIVRYTSDPDNDFLSLIPESRWIMIGETHDTGFAVTLASHTQNAIVFATDGTMLISAGDGASMLGMDIGGPRNSCCSSNTAEIDGIISHKEQIGAFRSQLVDTHSGKILRIDPATAEGITSNPYFDAKAPSAPRSRVWMLGLRNPYTFSIRPGTGSNDPNNADPGVLMIGDVGWDTWERFVVGTEGGQNFGWPVFEGLIFASSYPNTQVANLDAPNPLFDGGACSQQYFYFTDLIVQESMNKPSFNNPCDANSQIPSELTFMNRRGEAAWRNSRVFATPLTMVPIFDGNGNAQQVSIKSPNSPVQGPHMGGVATVSGVFYTGNKWPEQYQGKYLFSDAVDGWIKTSTFDTNHDLAEIEDFRPVGFGQPTGMMIDKNGYALYFANHGSGNPGAGQIRRIVVDCNDNGVGDDIDIQTKTSQDLNGNGIPDECDLTGDLNGDGVVGTSDLLVLFSNWGPCFDCDACLGDLDSNCSVGTSDLLLLFSFWGS